MSENLEIIKAEDVTAILSGASGILMANENSVTKATAHAKKLLAIYKEHGMTPELDTAMNDHLVKVKARIKSMNEDRAPITQYFTRLSKRFTSLEGEMKLFAEDPIQEARNEYARLVLEAKKKQEAAQLLESNKASEIIALSADCERQIRKEFESYCNFQVLQIRGLVNSATLETFDNNKVQLQSFSNEYPLDAFLEVRPQLSVKFNTPEVIEKVIGDVRAKVIEAYSSEYKALITDHRMQNIDKLQGKWNALLAEKEAEDKRLKLDQEQAAAEQARLVAKNEADIKAAQEKQEELRQQALKDAADEAYRKTLEATQQAEEDKRLKNEAETRANAAMESIDNDMHIATAEQLFEAEALKAEQVGPAAKVLKKIVITHPTGILPIINQWFSLEGKLCTNAELMKKFKPMITFCEKLANKDGIFIESKMIDYVDDVKAINE